MSVVEEGGAIVYRTNPAVVALKMMTCVNNGVTLPTIAGIMLTCAYRQKKKDLKFGSWRMGASIPLPLACKASALPFELIPH